MSRSYSIDPLSNRLTAVERGAQQRNFSYDANGNVISETRFDGSVVNYVYNDDNRLVTVASADSAGSSTYQYNAVGQRVAKTVDNTSTHFIYSPEGQLLAEGTDKQYIYLYNQLVGYIHNNQLYYVHNDHLGRPEVITDQNKAIVWQAKLDAFNRSVLTSSIGDFNIGFPGQYWDAEKGSWYNYFRDYDVTTGRYLQSDPLGLFDGLNTYLYVGNNPIMYIDPYGLWRIGDPLSQGFVDFSAGFGDTISFGLTDWIRDQIGINGAVNKCSGGYSAGGWAGVGYGFAAGGATGWRAAGQKATGKEFSHWIPNRYNGPRSKWNGNYVTPGRHYKHDPFRYPPRNKRSGDKWSKPIQQLDRIPNVYKGGALGGGAAIASSAGNGCKC